MIIYSQSLRYGYASVQTLWEEHKLKINSSCLDPDKKIGFDNNIVLENISFKYPNSESLVLDKINLKFLKGNFMESWVSPVKANQLY